MTSTYGFNWSWVSAPAETKKASGTVYQGGGTVAEFRQPVGGGISSSDLSAFARSVSQNFQHLRSDWRTYIRPILNSLPAGNADIRWQTAAGKGLPSKIDCFAYGVQGSTLFVFNDASSIKADGRYWHSTENRPKTIAEKFEDVYQEISNVSTSTVTESDVDLDPLWAAIGEDYRDGSVTSSLDTRCGTLESYLAQLSNDIYNPDSYPAYGLGSPLPYSIAYMFDILLQLHNVAGWGSDPSSAYHSPVAVASHTHVFTDITPAPAVASTKNRGESHVNLEDEVLRLRYEIQATRGSSSWYSDVNYPAPIGGAASLGGHIAMVGSGTVSAANPHGISYLDTDAVAVFSAMRLFTGMSDNTDSSPTYSSTYYITQGISLERAIGELDLAIHGITPAGITLDTAYDNFSGAATVNIDAKDLSWTMTGPYSFILNIGSCTGAVDGLQILNGTQSFSVLRSSTNKTQFTASVSEIDIETSVFYLFATTCGIGTDEPSAFVDIAYTGTVAADTAILELCNKANAASMANTETSLVWKQYYYATSGAAEDYAAKITVGAETNWTSEARTQSSYMTLNVIEGGDWVEGLRVNSSGCVEINGSFCVGFSEGDLGGITNLIAIANGLSAPSVHINGGIQIFSADSVDNTATLGLFLEQAVESIGTWSATHKFKLNVNGVWYSLAMKAE